MESYQNIFDWLKAISVVYCHYKLWVFTADTINISKSLGQDKTEMQN